MSAYGVKADKIYVPADMLLGKCALSLFVFDRDNSFVELASAYTQAVCYKTNVAILYLTIVRHQNLFRSSRFVASSTRMPSS